MNTLINGLNVVVAELQLVIARLANGETGAAVKAAVSKAQDDLAAIQQKIIGQGSGGDDTTSP